MTRLLPSDDDRPVLVLGPNPTPNGGMHLGHLAGPYLAGDVYARYLRARGRHVIFTTGTDDSQTYVVAPARPGRNHAGGAVPSARRRRSSAALERDRHLVDGFAPFDEGYRADRAASSSAPCTPPACSG